MTSYEQDPLRVAERVNEICGDDLHARRVWSLTNGVMGTINAAVLSIEETFRDQKNFRFGMGLSATHIGSPDRRDRLLAACCLLRSRRRCSVLPAKRAALTEA